MTRGRLISRGGKTVKERERNEEDEERMGG
jgi:hypothetical protein